ncbi:MAG TPA: DUF1684 domain-containing protein [Vicinamibacterales bacterium]|nr:DUF1684 domain-containing protein [Vicinamibacterales bacterium]
MLIAPSLLTLLLTLPASPSYRAEIEQYRRARVAELTADDGWLTVAGLFWLKAGANTAGSDPRSGIVLPAKAPRRIGVFTFDNAAVTFHAAPGVRVTAGDMPVTVFTFDPGKDDDSAIRVGDLTMFVIRRGRRLAVRMRDQESDARRRFRGLEYFPIRPEYRVVARFVAYRTPKHLPIPNVLGETVDMEAPGYVEFVLHGRTWRLEPVYETAEHKDLFFIFKDGTSGHGTYGAGRFLHADLPRNGKVVVDFNKAYNPPCAFTAFATCPLPPRQNQLPIGIEAGELNYRH